jgi:TP901 family phage tail tape measure protein
MILSVTGMTEQDIISLTRGAKTIQGVDTVAVRELEDYIILLGNMHPKNNTFDSQIEFNELVVDTNDTASFDDQSAKVKKFYQLSLKVRDNIISKMDVNNKEHIKIRRLAILATNSGIVAQDYLNMGFRVSEVMGQGFEENKKQFDTGLSPLVSTDFGNKRNIKMRAVSKFNEVASNTPSSMIFAPQIMRTSPEQVENTIFHEFGHAMHEQVASNPELKEVMKALTKEAETIFPAQDVNDFKKYFTSEDEVAARIIAQQLTGISSKFSPELVDKFWGILKKSGLLTSKAMNFLVNFSKIPINTLQKHVEKFKLTPPGPDFYLKGYASGGRVRKKGLAMLGENGEELIISSAILKRMESVLGMKVTQENLASAIEQYKGAWPETPLGSLPVTPTSELIPEPAQMPAPVLANSNPYLTGGGKERRSPANRGTRSMITRLYNQLIQMGLERDAALAEAKRLRFTNPKTDMANLEAMEVEINALQASGKVPGKDYNVIASDLSGFKSVNDQFGHGVGDEALRGIGKALSGVPGVKPYHRSGDEFGFIVEGDRKKAKTAIKKISKVIQELTIDIPEEKGGQRLQGFGVDSEVANTLKEADEAVNAVKSKRKAAVGQDPRLATIVRDLNAPGQALSLPPVPTANKTKAVPSKAINNAPAITDPKLRVGLAAYGYTTAQIDAMSLVEGYNILKNRTMAPSTTQPSQTVQPPPVTQEIVGKTFTIAPSVPKPDPVVSVEAMKARANAKVTKKAPFTPPSIASVPATPPVTPPVTPPTTPPPPGGGVGALAGAGAGFGGGIGFTPPPTTPPPAGGGGTPTGGRGRKKRDVEAENRAKLAELRNDPRYQTLITEAENKLGGTVEDVAVAQGGGLKGAVIKLVESKDTLIKNLTISIKSAAQLITASTSVTQEGTGRTTSTVDFKKQQDVDKKQQVRLDKAQQEALNSARAIRRADRAEPAIRRMAEGELGGQLDPTNSVITFVNDTNKLLQVLTVKIKDASGKVVKTTQVAQDMQTGEIDRVSVINQNRATRISNDRRVQREANVQAERAFNRERTAEQLRNDYPEIMGKFSQTPEFLDTANTRFQFVEKNKIRRYTATHVDPDTGQTVTKRIETDLAGNVLPQATQHVTRLTDAIANNAKQFFQWSMAVALIYTPLQKLGEITQTAIRNQTLLANALVTVGKGTEYTNQIFNDSLEIANETGVAVTGVIEGYNLALRATGNIADETERFATANTLLRDSITLSKLAGIDQASATDILVASLRQANLGLSEGQTLLDSWVKTARVANVDVNTLATSFAIAGESAGNAGLNMNELNGLVATVAASGITSPKETGNAVRAIIAGTQSTGAVNELEKYGISTKTTSGEDRTFKSIISDVKTLLDKKLISQGDLQAIGLAIGGGNRRMVPAINSIMGLEDINKIAGESATGQGEAWKALQIQLGTVETAITKLSNSFMELSQVLGTSGGLLSSATSSLNVLTQVVEMFTKIGKFTGAGLPNAVMTGIAGVAGFGGNLQQLGVGISKNMYLMENKADVTREATRIQNTTRGLTDNEAKAAARASIAQTDFGAYANRGRNIGVGIQTGFQALAAAAPYIGNDNARAFGNVAGVAVGSIGGEILAKTISSKFMAIAPGVGGAIGGAILNIVVESIAQKLKEANDRYFNPETDKKGNVVSPTYSKEVAKLTEEQKLGLYAMTGGREVDVDRIQSLANTGVEQLKTRRFLGKGGKTAQEGAELLAEERRLIAEGEKRAPNQGLLNSIREVFGDKQGTSLKSFLGENVSLDTFTPARSTFVSPMLEQLQQGNSAQLAQLRSEAEAYLKSRTDKNSDQRLTSAQYLKATKNLEGAEAKVTSFTATAMIDQFKSMPSDIQNASSALEAFMDIAVKGSPEAVAELTTLSSEIQYLYEKLSSGAKTVLIDGEEITAEAARKRLERDQALFGTAFTQTRRDIQINTPQRNIYGMGTVDSKYFNRLVEEAKKNQEKIYTARGGTSDEAIAARATDEATKLIIEFKDSYKELNGINQDALGKAYEDLKAAGEIIEAPRSAGFTDYADFTPQQLQLAASQANAMDARLREFAKANGTTYGGEITSDIVQANDKQLMYLTTNFPLFQAFLQEIAENTKKLVDGQYNLPDGSSFWVPYSAVQSYYNKTTTPVEPPTVPVVEPQPPKVEEPPPVQAPGMNGNQMPEYLQQMIAAYTTNPVNPNMSINPLADQNNPLWQSPFRPLGPNLPADYQAPTIPGWRDAGAGFMSDIGTSTASLEKLPEVSTKLNLNVQSTFQVNLDGKTIANVIKKFLVSDLLKFGNNTNSISKTIQV